MLERRTRLTEGVRIDAGRVRCDDLALDLDSDSARWHGLVSTDVGIRLGQRIVWLPSLFSASGRRVPHGIVRGLLGAAAHYAIGMMPIVSLLAILVPLSFLSGSALFSWLGITAAILLLSTIVHEAGHLLAYRALMGTKAPAIAVASGANCRIVRLRGSSSKDVVVLLSGPLAPLIVSAAFIPWWSFAPGLVLFAVMIGIGHASTAALPFGDGAAIRDILRDQS